VVAFDRLIVWSESEHAEFFEWVSTNYPEDRDALHQFPFELSITEANQAGELIANHASEWREQISD